MPDYLMNFAESVSYLYSLGNEVLAMKFGLETIRTLAAAFDNPQQKFPAIHIAGTNGKGSTAAMTDAILRAAGYRTGLYTSPNLISITERFCVDGRQIEEDDFARLAMTVRQMGEQLVAEGNLETAPTFFEQITMIGYLHFAESNVDLAVLEVGMGGRLDATNVCQPAVTVITPVGLDHQQYLGSTLAQIAGEKAGIIKPNIPVVVSAQEDEAMQTIAARAAALNAPLISVADQQFLAEPGGELGQYRLRYHKYNALLSLRGQHQVTNAMTAIHIAEQLNQAGWKIQPAAIETGLSKTTWPGRLQLIHSSNLPAPLLLDGAHNPAGARALRKFLDDHCQNLPITMIFGALQDKALTEMAGILFPAAREVILTKANSPRAAELPELAHQAVRTKNVKEALAEASRLTPPNGLIVICGSLYLVGEAIARIQKG